VGAGERVEVVEGEHVAVAGQEDRHLPPAHQRGHAAPGGQLGDGDDADPGGGGVGGSGAGGGGIGDRHDSAFS
jgi:hypothetical protein